MKMLEAMKKCLPGGHVARMAYPNRKFFKDENGVFPEATKVDFIDSISRDWECCPPDCRNIDHCSSDEVRTSYTFLNT